MGFMTVKDYAVLILLALYSKKSLPSENLYFLGRNIQKRSLVHELQIGYRGFYFREVTLALSSLQTFAA